MKYCNTCTSVKFKGSIFEDEKSIYMLTCMCAQIKKKKKISNDDFETEIIERANRHYKY